jgi:hypothetical protein
MRPLARAGDALRRFLARCITCGGEIARRTKWQPTESAPNTLLSKEFIAATSKTETTYVEAVLSSTTYFLQDSEKRWGPRTLVFSTPPPGNAVKDFDAAWPATSRSSLCETTAFRGAKDYENARSRSERPQNAARESLTALPTGARRTGRFSLCRRARRCVRRKRHRSVPLPYIGNGNAYASHRFPASRCGNRSRQRAVSGEIDG